MPEIAVTDRTDMTIVPVVSIGMPVYNGEKYIREALDSLLGQSFTNFELIISDNGSTDGTASICQEYEAKDSRVRYVRQPVNLGALANFSYVLHEARGGYFMWAAADDKWDPSWVKEMLSRMEEAGVNAAFGKVQCIDENSKKLDHYANNLAFEYMGPRWLRQLKYFLQFEGAGKANPIYAVWRTIDLKKIKLDEYQYDYLIVFDLLEKTEMAGCRNSKIYKRIHADCEGGGVPTPSNKSTITTIYRIWNCLLYPIPSGLISGYLRLASTHRVLLFLTLPFKYLAAYWFFISSRRLFHRNLHE